MSTNAIRRARPQGSWVSMWIEKYCQQPNGKFVLLTFTQKETIGRSTTARTVPARTISGR